MQPALGWTMLSPEAIRQAEARLREDAQGVRDELGFLFLHQGYADRFFPGTSVQQTRLRYALFVPWIYLRVAELDLQRRRQQSIERLIQAEEVSLTGRLLRGGESDGVIGRKVYVERRPSSQPATMVYWVALAKWGLLRRLGDGSIPSRTSVQRKLISDWGQGPMRDEFGLPIEEGNHTLFSYIPKPPESWRNNSESLNFRLQEDERAFLQGQLLTTRRDRTSEPSLLARLAEKPKCVESARAPWSRSVFSLADASDRAALERARRAAALAAIGRAIYASLVEELRDHRDGVSTSMRHRTQLPQTLADFRDSAMELDIAATCEDVPSLPGSFITLLKETQQWLTDPRDAKLLLDRYANTERGRKGNRARLVSTPLGRQRRAEWENEKHTLAEPLHYRWNIVRRMLLDLDNA